MKEKNSKIIIILLSVVILVLLLLVLFLCFKDEIKDEICEDYYSDQVITENRKNVIEDNNNSITNEEAIQIALDNLKLKKEDVYDLNSELDYKYNTKVYEIDFHYNNYEYEYYIDTKDGKIIKSFKDID